MRLAEGIRTVGFRKWYERELLQSHAHLALCFLCVVGVFAAIEAAQRFRSLTDQAIDLTAVLVCGGAGLWALRRYLYLLTHAEFVANQADCPSCGTYARFRLVGAQPGRGTVHVGCGQCRHEWTIDEGVDADPAR